MASRLVHVTKIDVGKMSKKDAYRLIDIIDRNQLFTDSGPAIEFTKTDMVSVNLPGFTINMTEHEFDVFKEAFGLIEMHNESLAQDTY